MTEAIKVDHINKQIKKRRILDDINFSVTHGDIFGYLGPNGAGKTTTMRIILGLMDPSSGTATVNEHDLSKNTEAREKVGVLLERDGVYDRITAYENLDYYARLYGIDDREKKIAGMLEMAGLTERKNDKVGQFSRGMKRKLGIARALIHEPDVLFLDEPTAGLDPEAQKMVRDLLLELSKNRKMTVFLNSHDLDEVQRICSRIAIIQNGSIRVCDSLKNLQGKPGNATVRVTLSDKSNAAAARKLLEMVEFASFGTQESENVITASLREGKKPSDLLPYLVKADIKVEELTLATQSLEDIYIEVMHQEENR